MIRKILLMAGFGLVVSTVSLVAYPTAVQAATAENCTQASGGLLSFPTWYKYLDPQFVDNECQISFVFPDDIGAVLLAVFEIVLRVASMISIGFVIYGGFRYILSQGDPESTKGARQTIINALIGLVVTIFAAAIVNVIARNLA